MKHYLKSHQGKGPICLTFAALLLAIPPAFSRTVPGLEYGANLIQNPGFENGIVAWRNASVKAKSVSDVTRSGGHSLYYENTDNKAKVAFGQELAVRPGQKLLVSAWIKGEEIKGPGIGFNIRSFTGSQYSDGFFPVSKAGTFDWTRLSTEFIVPPNATRTTVELYFQDYLGSGTTGKAWFDDVEVRAIPFEVTAVYPNYRGLVKKGDRTAWSHLVELYPEPQWKNAPVKIHTELSDSSGKVLLRKQNTVPSSRKSYTVKIEPPRNLAAGEYTLTHRIADPNGTLRLVHREPIRIVQEMPRVHLDSQGFTIVNGERFFPMGVYLSAATDKEEDLERISKAGFNTVLSYLYGYARNTSVNPEQYMDLAQKHDLKVVYSLKDMYPKADGSNKDAFNQAESFVKRVQDKPALLAWYTNDELPPALGWYSKLEEMQNLVKKHDRYDHPIFHAQNKYASLPYSYHLSDILAMDLYPVGWGDDLKLDIISSETRRAARTMRGVKGTWIVPQIFDWSVYAPSYKQRFPTLDEMRNQSYQAIINGAQGLIYYSYFDLFYEKHPPGSNNWNEELFKQRWKNVSAMSKEIKEIIPAVLHGKWVDLKLPHNPRLDLEAHQDGNKHLYEMAKPDYEPYIEIGALQHGNSLLLLMANPADSEKSITVTLPGGWKIQDATQGQIKSTFAKGKVTFTLPAVGSGVFRLTKK
jgi:hypothetical protein